MKKNLFFLIIMSFIMILCCSCNNNIDHVDDISWEKVQKSGKLILGMDDSFPPMGYMDVNTGEFVGFDVDIAQKVCERLGIKLVLQPISWVSKELELNNGNVDCIWNGLSKTYELEKNLNLSFPYMKNHQCLLVKLDSTYISSIDLIGKRVGVQAESSAEHALDKNVDFKNSLFSIIQVDTYLKGIMELNNNTIDALAIDEIVARYYIKQSGGQFKIICNENGEMFSLADEEYVIGFRKYDNSLKNKIEQTLKEFSYDGTLGQISYKWFGEDITIV